MSARQTRELYAYVERYPIDDESNFQVPIAGLYALLFNIHRAENTRAITREECMPFRPAAEEPSIDEAVLSDQW